MEPGPRTEDAEQIVQVEKENYKEFTHDKHMDHTLAKAQVMEMRRGARDRPLLTDGWPGLAVTVQDFTHTDQAKQVTIQ